MSRYFLVNKPVPKYKVGDRVRLMDGYITTITGVEFSKAFPSRIVYFYKDDNDSTWQAYEDEILEVS